MDPKKGAGRGRTKLLITLAFGGSKLLTETYLSWVNFQFVKACYIMDICVSAGYSASVRQESLVVPYILTLPLCTTTKIFSFYRKVSETFTQVEFCSVRERVFFYTCSEWAFHKGLCITQRLNILGCKGWYSSNQFKIKPLWFI